MRLVKRCVLWCSWSLRSTRAVNLGRHVWRRVARSRSQFHFTAYCSYYAGRPRPLNHAGRYVREQDLEQQDAAAVYLL